MRNALLLIRQRGTAGDGRNVTITSWERARTQTSWPKRKELNDFTDR